MKFVISLLGNYALLILILVFLEGVVTVGKAFQFETYNWFGWFCQGCALVVLFYAAFSIAEEHLHKE